MSAADKQSRLKTSLITSGNSHYDQCLILSSSIINQSFVALTAVYPEAQSIDVSDPDVGYLKGDIHPAEVYVVPPGVSGARVGYIINWKNGRLKSLSGALDVSMEGWKLAVKVNLESQDKTKAPPAVKAFIDDNFQIPGDYSVARLYAKLTSGKWGDFDLEHSTFGTNPDTGRPMTWDEWVALDSSIVYKLPALLGGWAYSMDQKGLTTLGVKVALPDTPQNPLNPTFPPTYLIHQALEYRNDATPEETREQFHSLVYSEMVNDNTPPTLVQLGNFGNFVYPPAGSTPGIFGTFALARELFLEVFLHPQFTPFNRLSELLPYTPSFYDYGMSWTYSCGYNAAHPESTDPYFKFKPDPVNDPTQLAWHIDNAVDTIPPHRYSNGSYGAFTSHGITDITVTWPPGQPAVILLNGHLKYTIVGQFSNNSDMSYPSGWLKQTYEATWQLTINIATNDKGALDLSLKNDTNSNAVAQLNVRMTQDDRKNVERPEGQEERIRSSINNNLNSSLTILRDNLAKMMATSNDFVYPGNGTLNFKNPTFNTRGDLLTEITFKPSPPGTKVAVPGPESAPFLKPYPRGTEARFGINAYAMPKSNPEYRAMPKNSAGELY